MQTVKLISRYIFTDSSRCNISREVKFMNKFIKRSQSKRNPFELNIINSTGGTPKTQLSVHTLRRMSVLNKVFMEYITDIMSTGEIEPEILNRNIEISHVKVTADFKFINVFWIDNCIEKSDTAELLKQFAFELRHKLSQLRVIGCVPPIQFVKCKEISRAREVEEKLKNMDFGDDYVPSVYPNVKHHTVTASGAVELESLEDNFSINIPVMRHDVFGLDHKRIMSKIKASLNKSKKASKKEVTKMPLCSSKLDVEKITSFLPESEQQEQFTKFLNQKRKERRLKLKRKNRQDIYDLAEESNNDDYDIEGDYPDNISCYNDNDEFIDEEFDEKR